MIKSSLEYKHLVLRLLKIPSKIVRIAKEAMLVVTRIGQKYSGIFTNLQ